MTAGCLDKTDDKTRLLVRTGSGTLITSDCWEDNARRESTESTGNSVDRFGLCGLWQECKTIFWLALPISLTSLMTYLFGPVSIAFCGHLGKVELDAAGLAMSIFNVFGVTITMGLLTACETLFAQTYGGANPYRMGIQLQRGLVIITICCLPCWTVHLLIEPILLLLKQNPQVAKLVGKNLLIMMPGLWDRPMVPVLFCTLGNACNIILHYIILYHSNAGLSGSAISQVIGYFVQLLGLSTYFVCSGFYKKTCSGYNRELWRDWDIWFELALPGFIMTGFEWWVFEIGTFATGMIGETELGAQTVLFNISFLSFTLLPLGICIASSIRIGHGLGSKNIKQVKTTTYAALFILNISSSVLAVLWFSLRYYLPKLWTNNADVNRLVIAVFPILTVSQLLDGALASACGIIRGAGLQKFGAIICFVGMYMVAVPTGLSLLFLTELQVKGQVLKVTFGSNK